MEKYGDGGGIVPSSHYDISVLDGLLSTDNRVALLDPAHCANPRCRKLFRPRADGDMYCRNACDLDSNPQYKGRTDRQ